MSVNVGIALLSLLIVLMLVSGEKELVRVKRLNNKAASNSNNDLSVGQAVDATRSRRGLSEPAPFISPADVDDVAATKLRRSPLHKPASRQRVRRVAEDPNFIKRHDTDWTAGDGDAKLVKLKRQKRPTM